MLPTTNSKPLQTLSQLFRLFLSGCALFFLPFTAAAADTDTVRVGLTTTDYKPYWKITADRIEGLVVDRLHQIFEGSEFQLKIIPVPRKRIEQAFNEGDIDIRISDIRWLDASHRYHASDVFMQLDDVYWSRNIKYLPYPTKACAVLGFVYSAEFDRKITDGSFIRVNVTHPTQAFQMLAYNRCDIAIADSRLGRHIVERDNLQGKVKQLNWKDRTWALRFIAQPTEKGLRLINLINRNLNEQPMR